MHYHFPTCFIVQTDSPDWLVRDCITIQQAFWAETLLITSV